MCLITEAFHFRRGNQLVGPALDELLDKTQMDEKQLSTQWMRLRATHNLRRGEELPADAPAGIPVGHKHQPVLRKHKFSSL